MSSTENKRKKIFEICVYQKYVSSGQETVETGFNNGEMVRETEGGRKGGTEEQKKRKEREPRRRVGGKEGKMVRLKEEGREGTK